MPCPIEMVRYGWALLIQCHVVIRIRRGREHNLLDQGTGSKVECANHFADASLSDIYLIANLPTAWALVSVSLQGLSSANFEF